MTVAVYLPLLVCGFLALAAKPLARRLPPGPGAWALVAAALVGAMSGLWTVGLLVASLIDDLPFLAKGQPPLPVYDGVSVLASVVLAWCLVRVARELRRQRQLRRALGVLRSLPGDDLVVLPHERALAFALPGQPGRVVATDTMLRALSPSQTRVLIAHERAHLDARHPAALALGQFAAAANPLLVPVARAAGYLCERHADECAASVTGDRELAATALAAAALASADAGRTRAADRAASLLPSFHETAVIDRISALRTPATRPRRIALVTAAAAIALAIGTAAHATGEFAELARAFLPH